MSDNVRIHTVLGEIEPSVLGRTLMHEHIFCDMYRVTGRLNELLNDEALSVNELAALRKAGGTALVEVTTPDLGRDPEALCRVAEKTELHIIMGTGWYRQPFYPPEIDRLSTNELADMMITELTDGVEGTGIRAGIIGEIGVHLGLCNSARRKSSTSGRASSKGDWRAINNTCLYVSCRFIAA